MASEQLNAAIEFEKRLAQGMAEAGADLGAAREYNTSMMLERAGELPSSVVVQEADADGVGAEWVSRGGESPVVLFVHSGGMVVGAALENREFLGRLTESTGGRALAIDYRLAPENAWPAALEDVLTAYRWLVESGVSPKEIVIGAESGGGTPALRAVQVLRDEGEELPAGVFLLSPLIDLALESESYDRNADTDPFVSREAVGGMMAAVLQGQDPKSVSPLEFDLTGLPPVFVQAGTAEAVFDDGDRLVTKIKSVGGSATFEPWADMIHLWHGFPDLPEAEKATRQVAKFVLNSVELGA